MGLYTTFDRNTPESDKLLVLAWLASKYQDLIRASPKKAPIVLISGYMPAAANEDAVFAEIEVKHMQKITSSIANTLLQLGVSASNVYSEVNHSYMKGHLHKVDIFLQQYGETGANLPPTMPPVEVGPPRTEEPKPAREREISISSKKRMEVEVEVYKVFEGTRTIVPELKLTGAISSSLTRGAPVEVEFGGELLAWKPNLESLLKKLKLNETIEFAVKIKGSGKLSADDRATITTAIEGKIQAGLTVKVNRSVKVEFSFSEGFTREDGSTKEERVPMIKLIWNF